MRPLYIVSLFTLIFPFICAQEFRGYFTDPDSPGKCFFGGVAVLPGNKVQLAGKCKLFICQNRDGSGIVRSCGPQKVDSPCMLGDFLNVNASFPDCCRREVICP
ncbi:uncharacterized protein LOC106094259 [Stomoxys calcitrans]|uniref:uncharacterized protein LOC106094259 n=1 Tax=Stomoxys calcitrans TaxID=35570 RepID=UPI0027E30EA0|nr:uncharacterized protein LOC106094259 [Stomoxys calcitrans]